MSDLRSIVERELERVELRPFTLEAFHRYREQKQRNKRIAAGVLGLAIAIVLSAVVIATSIDRGRSTVVPGDSDAPTVPPGLSPLGPAIVGIDGTVQVELGLPKDAWMPDLSSDGTQIMFLTRSTRVGFCGACVPGQERIAAIAVGESAGSFIYLDPGVRQVEQPVWSPDGTQIAFVGVSKQDGNRDIYVAQLQDRDGLIDAQTRRLTFDPAVDGFPAWSPDGSTIVYDNGGAEPLDDSGFSHTQEIWSVPAKGGTPERLTNNEVADAQADVATDGTVAFWRVGEIWTMDQTGEHQQRLETVPPGIGWFNPRWSPNGMLMALLRYDPTERAEFDHPRDIRHTNLPLLEVVVVDLTTGHITLVGPRVASDVNPVSWTSDGLALLINRYDAGT